MSEPDGQDSNPTAAAQLAASLAESSAFNANRAADAASASAEKAATAAAGKLDSVLATVAGGVTSLLALFVGVGLSADRMAVIFNGGSARGFIVVALASAVAAVVLGLVAVLATTNGSKFAGWAIFALAASLGFGIAAAPQAFQDGGRPTITKVSLVSEGDTHATLSFTVTATGVAHDNLLRAFASWVPGTVPTDSPSPGVHSPSAAPAPRPAGSLFYVTTLRPDDKGVVSQDVTVLLERPAQARYIRLQVYWDETNPTPTPTTTTERLVPPADVGVQCGNQADSRRASACVDVVMVAATSPTATPSVTAVP